jgi:FkbM family methyltransferase
MHVVLLMVGAHTGEKRRENILQAATKGVVILIEPVPFLFKRLSQTYAAFPNITILNYCVSPRPGKISFFAPTEEAIKVCPWGDQLGSMSADHAVRHNPALAPYIEEIQVEALTFPQLLDKFNIISLDVLFTDVEGYDTTLLPHFPFNLVLPKRIVFEYKHSDGTFNIGRNLGKLLIMLDELGYDMRIMDDENCLAARRPALTG